MAYNIRKMDENDWEKVSEIYTDGIMSGKSTFQPVCPTYEQFDSSKIKDLRFVAHDGAEIAGWCAAGPTSARECYRGVIELSLYIALKHQRHGLGKMLMEHMIRESEKRGYWCIYSVVLSVNSASIYLMQNCGFRQIGFREKIAKDRFGVWQDVTLFEKRSEKI